MRIVRLLLLVVMSALPLAASATLTEYMIYHPAMCTADEDTSLTSISIDADSVLNTNGTTSVRVSCPVPREMLSGTSSSSPFTEVEINYIDNNSTTNMSCTLTLCSVYGGDCFWETVTSSGAQSYRRSMYITGWVPGAAYTVEHLAHLRCLIPAAASGGNYVELVSYAVNYPG